MQVAGALELHLVVAPLLESLREVTVLVLCQIYESLARLWVVEIQEDIDVTGLSADLAYLIKYDHVLTLIVACPVTTQLFFHKLLRVDTRANSLCLDQLVAQLLSKLEIFSETGGLGASSKQELKRHFQALNVSVVFTDRALDCCIDTILLAAGTGKVLLLTKKTEKKLKRSKLDLKFAYVHLLLIAAVVASKVSIFDNLKPFLGQAAWMVAFRARFAANQSSHWLSWCLSIGFLPTLQALLMLRKRDDIDTLGQSINQSSALRLDLKVDTFRYVHRLSVLMGRLYADTVALEVLWVNKLLAWRVWIWNTYKCVLKLVCCLH